MPVGKNSIKRAVSNGYSNVQTSAPDMEHSEVLVKEVKAETPVKAPAAKKPAAKKACATKKATPAKTQEKASEAKKAPAKKTVVKTAKKEGFARVEVGSEMPYYLL